MSINKRGLEFRLGFDLVHTLAGLNGEWEKVPYPPGGEPAPDSRARITLLSAALTETHAKTADLRDERVAVLDEDGVNQLLSEYPTVHHVTKLRDKNGDLHWKITEGTMRGRPFAELLAVRGIVGLAKLGRLDRLRTCRCGRWFYAERADRIVCSARCRQRAYEQSDKVKAHKRDYMRWYYNMYQSPKAPAKKLTLTQWLKRQKSTATGNKRPAHWLM